MKNSIMKKLLAIAGCATLFCAVDVTMTYAASYEAAKATVVKPITVTKQADLNFGKFIAGSGGTVTIAAADGTKSATGVTLPDQWKVDGVAGNFTLEGEKDATYAVVLDPTADLTGSAGGTMSVALTSSTTGTLDSVGAGAVKVGGVLTVGSSQTAGDYTGSFNLTVNYN